MRRLLIVMVFLINPWFVNAQTFQEWFKQKETQIRYLVEQIGALKAYGEVINTGYDIAHNGLSNVINNKEGDYRQHSTYFLSLWKVKRGVKSYDKVLSILSMREDIEKQSRLIKPSTTGFLNDQERSYVNAVFANLISGCNDLTDELQMIINDDQLELKDDERIQRIDNIYLQMQDRYEFSQLFANEIKLLVTSRVKEEKDANQLYLFYGIK